MVSNGFPNVTTLGREKPSVILYTLCGCSKILPTKSTSISAVRLSYTYARTFALYGAVQNRMRVIASFIGRLTS